MLDAVLNPDGPFSLHDVRGYDFMLNCVGYGVLPLLGLPWLLHLCVHSLCVGYRIIRYDPYIPVNHMETDLKVTVST